MGRILAILSHFLTPNIYWMLSIPLSGSLIYFTGHILVLKSQIHFFDIFFVKDRGLPACPFPLKFLNVRRLFGDRCIKFFLDLFRLGVSNCQDVKNALQICIGTEIYKGMTHFDVLVSWLDTGNLILIILVCLDMLVYFY